MVTRLTKEEFLESLNIESKDIIGFRKEYIFLSNSYVTLIYCDDFIKRLKFKNAEALFQATKCPYRAVEFTDLSAEESKILGKEVKQREDWVSIQYELLKYVLRLKFNQNECIKDHLILTGNSKLINENSEDTIYGTVNGEGMNLLGKALMELRDEFKIEYCIHFEVM